MRWYTDLGIRPDHLQLREHGADELSHYSSATSDIEYLFPMGWSELEGIANRGDFDLTQHAEFSGEKLEYVDPGTGERYVPHVIEPSAGADRGTLAFMVDAYDEEEVEGRERVLLRLHPRLAPVKVAVLPLVNKDGQPEMAREIYEDLRTRMPAEFDTGGSIGKRYRRQDEIGTPWGVTIDHQTMEDDTVTLRDRDSLDQSRIAIDELGDELERRLARALELARSWASTPAMQPLFEHRLELAGYRDARPRAGGRGAAAAAAARLRRQRRHVAAAARPPRPRRPRARWRSTCRASAPATGSTRRADPPPARPLRRRGGRVVRARGRRRGVRQLARRLRRRCAWPSATDLGRRCRARGAGGARHGALVRRDRARAAAARAAGVAGPDAPRRSCGGSWPRSTARLVFHRPADVEPADRGHLRVALRRPGHHRRG